MLYFLFYTQKMILEIKYIITIMDIQDINNIIVEISNLKNKELYYLQILTAKELYQTMKTLRTNKKKSRYTLPRMYALVKRIQNWVNQSLYGNDVNAFIQLFSTVETIRQKLSQKYQIR